ncbi:GlsB/YeaQ/YmgE family stress response membrane protein [bacterium BFN5]|nr:GlsB/YeaQ/YmgE family stress response membrane protein [bacterium BFN5]
MCAVIGAYVGGFLFSLMGFNNYGTIGTIIVSTIGAMVFLWVLSLFTGSKRVM